MSELVEFLRARLDEDERVATVLGDDMRQSWAIPEDESVAVIHMHRHAPARILAEVDAKRRIVDEIAPGIERLNSTIESEWGGSDGPYGADLLVLLALPYADHPDYRDEWRPS